MARKAKAKPKVADEQTVAQVEQPIAEQAIDAVASKATELLEGIKGVLDSSFKVFDAGKAAEVALLEAIQVAFNAFIKATSVKPVAGWEKYFQPYLELHYPGRGWGRKSKDNYFRMLASPEKKKLFLNGQLELSTGRKKVVAILSEEKKLENAVASVNKWVKAICKKGKKALPSVSQSGELVVTIQ